MLLIGAVGVGAFAYFDTLQVAKDAVELFESDLIVEAEPVATKDKDLCRVKSMPNWPFSP